MRLFQLCFILSLLLGANAALAIDADGDGSDAYEESLAGTSDSDPGQRPYWSSTFIDGNFYGVYGFVRVAGDINNDGYDDILSGPQDMAVVRSGKDGQILYEKHALDYGGGGFFGEAATSAAGDVNNDGYDDFIVGDYQGGNRAYVFSGADGSVLHFVSGAGGWFGSRVAGAGDINNDGYDDFAVSDRDAGASQEGIVNIYSGFDASILRIYSGDATYDQFGTFIFNAGDINGDGYQDLLVSAAPVEMTWDGEILVGNAYVRVISGLNGNILLNIGSTDFFRPVGVPFGDVNNDGYTDIAIQSSILDSWLPDFVRVFSGANGALLYQYEAQDDSEFFHPIAALGDTNNDGYDDFMINSSVADQSRIYSGQNGQLLHALVSHSNDAHFGSYAAGGGDFNGDGQPDFVMYASPEEAAENGFFRVVLSSDLANDYDLDFIVNSADPDDDNDGMPDTWETTYGLNPLVNDAAGDLDSDGFTNLQEFQNGTNPTVAPPAGNVKNDFDGDGDSDLLWRDTVTGQNVVWHMQNGVRSSYSMLGGNSVLFNVSGIGDVDKDGDDDILFYHSSTGQVVIWRMQGGEKQSIHVLGTSTLAVAGVGDFDADGDMDIFLRHGGTGQGVIWEIENAAKVSATVLGSNGANYGVDGIKDFDADGDADILFREGVGGQSVIWRIQDNAKVGAVVLGSNATAFSIKATADFDNDGDADILFRNDSTGQSLVWVIQNAAKVGAVVLGSNATSFYVAAAADFDGDGDSDVLYRDSSSGSNVIWTLQNNSKAGASVLGSNANTYNVAGTADFDGDGDEDILFRNSSGQNVVWLIQNAAKVGTSVLPTSGSAMAASFEK